MESDIQGSVSVFRLLLLGMQRVAHAVSCDTPSPTP